MRAPGEAFEEFRRAIELAEAEFEAEMLALVTAGAVNDPKLALKLLERRFPQRWSVAAARAAAESPDSDWR
jgi:hypothetical protein